MRYKLIFITFFLIQFSGFSQEITKKEQKEIIVPTELDWTERFILSEQKEIRIDVERLRREIYQEIHEMELSTVDKALSYSSNTLNYFFIFLTIIITALGVIGWRTLADTKKVIKENMEKEVQKTVFKFQKKIEHLEKSQEINILWRQYYSSESNNDRLEYLKKLEDLTNYSMLTMIERSNVYIDMEEYEKVISICNDILEEDQDTTQALYNRGFAYAGLDDDDKSLEDLNYLLKISPDYEDTIKEDEIFNKVIKKLDL